MKQRANSTLGVIDIIGDTRGQILELAAQHKAYNVRVFGSVARGEAHPESDLDLLVNFREGASIWDAVKLWRELKALMGRDVNVIAEEPPDTPFMQSVLKDAVPL